jgi:hypothetical protein
MKEEKVKKIIRLFVALSFFAVFTFSNSASGGSCGILGDINRDNRVGLQEAIYALQVSAGIQGERNIEGAEAEPNDIQDYPNSIFENTILTGTIGSGDDEEDWYKVTMPANGLFQYSLENLNSEGTEQGIIGQTTLYHQAGLDLVELNSIYIYRYGTGNCIRPTEKPISPYTAVAEGEVYFIKIPVYMNNYAPYELKTSFVQMEVSDIGESNQSASEAYVIQDNGTIEAIIGYGDDEEDWYQFSPSENGLLQYSVENLHPSTSNIDQGIIGATVLYQKVGLDLIELGQIYIYRYGTGNCIRPGEKPTSQYTVVSEGGNYYFKVPKYGYESAPYKLDTLFIASNTVDVAEPNDSPDNAENISENDVITAMIGYGGDGEDWYRITPTADGSFRFKVENLLESTAGIDQGIIGQTFLYQKSGLDLVEITSVYIYRYGTGNCIRPSESPESNIIAVSGGSEYYIKIPKNDYNAAPYTLTTSYLAD